MEIFGMAVITSLLAGALISNLGSISTTVFAQDSQNATQQQQQQGFELAGVLNFTQNLRTLIQESGLNTTSSSPENYVIEYNNSPMALILSNSLKG